MTLMFILVCIYTIFCIQVVLSNNDINIINNKETYVDIDLNNEDTYYIVDLTIKNKILHPIPINAKYSAIEISKHLCMNESNEEFKSNNIWDCMKSVSHQIISTRKTYNPIVNSTLYMNESIFPPLLNPYYVDNNNDNEIFNEEININGNKNFLELDQIINNNKQFAINQEIGSIIDTSYCPFRHAHIEQEFYSSLLNNINNFQTSKNRGAIVILAQAGSHSSYENRTSSIVELMKNLDYLYTNYNDQFKDDIWIFHEGDFTNSIQEYVRNNRKEIRFFHLKNENWAEYPEFIKGQVFRKKFSVGYRKMIRWYAIRIWETIAMLGYTWVWRLDDDSFILSPIKYNMFAFMEQFNYQYAYRNIAVEAPGREFWDFMQDFRHLMEGCILTNSLADFNYDNCGNMPSYYNNFFITNVTRWLEPEVQYLLKSFDESGMIFLDRWNDLSIQSVVVKLFFSDEKIHRFTGWGYAHHSGNPQDPFYGIIQSGVLETDQFATILNFAQKNSWIESRYLIADSYALVHDNMLSLSTTMCTNSIKTKGVIKTCCLC